MLISLAKEWGWLIYEESSRCGLDILSQRLDSFM
jgi:hypothetical protein